MSNMRIVKYETLLFLTIKLYTHVYVVYIVRVVQLKFNDLILKRKLGLRFLSYLRELPNEDYESEKISH